MSRFTIGMIPILLIVLSGCTPLMSVPQLESIDPVLWENFKDPQKGVTFILAVTELNLNDNTDLGQAFSELYLGDFLDNKVRSYISIRDFMYGGNQERLLITLNPTVVNSSDRFDVCLVSGNLVSNKLNVKSKWDCKSFRVSELMKMKESGKEFSLESTSAKTPKLDLLIYPQST